MSIVMLMLIRMQWNTTVRRCLCAALFVCVWSDAVAYRQTDHRHTGATLIDTLMPTKSIQLPTATIEGRQSLIETVQRSTPVTVLTATDIQRSGARQIADVLTAVPGLFIRHYGGLGGLQTVSLRGTSSAQNLILMNGVRMNSAQNGGMDMSTIPAQMMENIRIERGGQSALYGGGAIGGVIACTPRTGEIPSSAHGEYGSFDEVTGTLTGGHTIGGVRIGASMYGQYARGNYPFLFDQFGQVSRLRRENGDFRTLNGILTVQTQTGAWQHSTFALGRLTARGAPGAVVQGSIEQAETRLDERDGMLIHRAVTGWNSSVVEITGLVRGNTLRYRDPSATVFGVRGIDEEYHTADGLCAGTYTHKSTYFDHTLMWVLRGEIAYNRLRGRMLQPMLNSPIQRYTTALGGVGIWQYVPTSSQSIEVQAALRTDVLSDLGSALSPLVSAVFRQTIIANTQAMIRANIGRSFRAPSFNELYYLNFGNTQLQPEYAVTTSIGGGLVMAESGIMVSGEIDAFSVQTNNYILAVPISPVTWSAQNVGSVWTRGIEGAINMQMVEYDFTLRCSYTRQRATDEAKQFSAGETDLVYVPRELVGITMRKDFSAWHTGISMQYTGFRWSLPAQNIASLLPSFLTVHAFGEVQFSFFRNTMCLIRLDIDNVFDARYSVIRHYPAPGRMFRFGIRTTW